LRILAVAAICLALLACDSADAREAVERTADASATRAGDAGPAVPLTDLAQSSGTPEGSHTTQAASQISADLAQSRSSAIVTAAARVAPAVVSINVVRRERQASLSIWDRWFMPRGSERIIQGFGSGFIASSDGLVITNQHVIEGADSIVVTTRDGTDYRAESLGEDPLTDIAILKIEGTGLPTVSFGRSSELLIGEWVVAIGNPYSYLLGNSEATVTAGVVSAVGRDLIPSGEESGIYVDMIQTDAAINPGNSGGPLANALGEVVGVNSSIFSSSGGSVGIGFAIPIERALRVAEELRLHGAVRRPWLGLDVAGTDRLRDWKQTGGLEVTGVADGGPADRSGIRPGDILVSAAGRSTRTFLDWEGVKLDVAPGDSVTVVLRRGGRERTTTVIVEALPTTQAERVSALGDMELITLTPAIRQERGIRVDQGVLIYDVGSAARVGLRDGDVIFQINRIAITDADQVNEIFRRVGGTRTPIRLYLERGGRVYTTEFWVR
jgi:serine protease Do